MSSTSGDSLVRVQAELGRFSTRVRNLLPDGDVDHNQAAANELAWAVARVRAAEATAAWASATGDGLAGKIADAVIAEADASMSGQSADARVELAGLFESIAESYRPVHDLGASDEQRMLRETIREFARRRVLPRAAEVHRQDRDVPEDIIAGLAELGLFGISVPERYGGQQGPEEDFERMLIVTEELSRASLAIGGSLITRPEILVRALIHGGAEEQKRRWLPDIATGRKLVAVATTEPDHGSDLANITCRAERVAGGWRVTGTKLWCTFAGRAQLLMLLLRTADAGHKGLSVFVAEKPAFGGHEFAYVQPEGGRMEGRAIPTVGYRGMHTFELNFQKFWLPDDALVGGDDWLNRGFYLQMESFTMGRLQTAGRAVGVMQAAHDDAARYAQDRVVFGRPIASHGLAKASLGQMAVHLIASRQLSYQAARRLSAGDGQMEASLAKLYASKMAELVTRDAMQLHGGMGYAEETPASRYFLDARVLSIFEGAEEVLSLRVIARDLLAGG